jgi:hypothetical protein
MDDCPNPLPNAAEAAAPHTLRVATRGDRTMKKISYALLALLLAACSSSNPGSSTATATPGHGALSIDVIPNPIVAHNVSGDTYELPFDVVIRETGGADVTVQRVSLDVYALGAIHLYSISYTGAEIEGLGYSTRVPAGTEQRYHFNPSKSVPDDRLFGGVTAELRVDATDASGTPAVTRTGVSVRR